MKIHIQELNGDALSAGEIRADEFHEDPWITIRIDPDKSVDKRNRELHKRKFGSVQKPTRILLNSGPANSTKLENLTINY